MGKCLTVHFVSNTCFWLAELLTSDIKAFRSLWPTKKKRIKQYLKNLGKLLFYEPGKPPAKERNEQTNQNGDYSAAHITLRNPEEKRAQQTKKHTEKADHDKQCFFDVPHNHILHHEELSACYHKSMPKYPDQAEELMALHRTDQIESKAVGRLYWHSTKDQWNSDRAKLKQHMKQRAQRMLAILDEIGEPSLSNIGANAAQAVSVLAIHEGGATLKRVLDIFSQLYERNKEDTFGQAIPSMTDWWLLSQRKPERFATQWLFDKSKRPYLPLVEDFNPKDPASIERLNRRRAEYGIEPFRWPKSLAIPEDEQLWLKRPLTELVTRELTDAEYAELMK